VVEAGNSLRALFLDEFGPFSRSVDSHRDCVVCPVRQEG
jgi:hypothetical protein